MFKNVKKSIGFYIQNENAQKPSEVMKFQNVDLLLLYKCLVKSVKTVWGVAEIDVCKPLCASLFGAVFRKSAKTVM